MLNIILFLESIGGGELMVIILFILIFFGSKKIPELARGLGKGMREMKDVVNGVQSDIRQSMSESERMVKEETSKVTEVLKEMDSDGKSTKSAE